MVTCSNCGAENAANHAFCSSCGIQLAKPCPSCGTANDSDNRFCFSCGTNLGGDGPTPSTGANPAPTESSGARRLVSVVFADLVGFTTFSEHRDPEDVRNMLTHYYERCREIIGRFGGTTDKFIGDAVMGVWGAVEAHEDDAERATRAALELVDMVDGLGSELGIPELSARAGVLSGEASVGSGGNEQGLVVGDLVNTASRLQSIAAPGQVYVGESTKDLASGAIEFAPAGDHEVKGKTELVPAYRAVRVVAISSTARGGELGEAPFVGRDDELRLLKDQMHATGREGRARMVSVIGEAGIGKTRLSEELVRYIDGITELIYYHSGRSPSYGDGVTFWALGEMIRQRAGIFEGEDPTKSRMKLRTAVAEYAPDEDEQRWIEPRLAAVIGLAEMPTGDRSELYAALRTFFQRIADRGTVLMVFEDLHWADEGLLDFVEELVERTTQHPIMVISLSRPDLLERRNDWGASRRRSLLMHLSRLDDRSMRNLVAGLAPGLPDEVVDRIADRTAGVPLHAVEFVRMLYNSGVLVLDGDAYRLEGDADELSVPDSVSAIIGARLDRLEPEEAALVQDAAVLGQSFMLGSIADMRGVPAGAVETSLLQLVRRDILELDEDPRSPERGQFRFVQGLIREVAYGRLSKSERVARHLEVARRFESRDDPELAGVIAGHYASAAAADPDNAELAARARGAIIGAAKRAADLHSNLQAVALYQHAIDMTDDPADVASLQLDMAACYEDSGRTDRAGETAASALEYFRSVDDTEGVARAATGVASALVSEFEAGQAVEAILPVFEATPVTETDAWAKLAAQTSRALMLADRLPEAVEVADQALPVLERLGFIADVVETTISKGTALANSGRFLEGKALLMGAAEVAREYGLLLPEIRAINNYYAATTNDRTPRIADFLRVAEAVGRAGSEAWESRTAYFLVWGYRNDGDLDAAEALASTVSDFDLSDFWVDAFEQAALEIALRRHGTDADRVARLEEINDRMLLIDDPQIHSTAMRYRVAGRYFAKDFPGAVEAALTIEPDEDSRYPSTVQLGIMVACLAGDAESAEILRSHLPEHAPHFRMLTGLDHFADMAVAGLRGDTDAATESFLACQELWEVAHTLRELAETRALFAYLVGTDVPEAREAAEAAYEFFSNGGFGLELDIFSDVFASIDVEPAAVEATPA